MLDQGNIPDTCFYELRNDIPWDYQIRYLNMWQVVHALATIVDDSDTSDEHVMKKLAKLTLWAKRLDSVIPKPKTKGDDPDA